MANVSVLPASINDVRNWQSYNFLQLHTVITEILVIRWNGARVKPEPSYN